MARRIPNWLSGVLETLELERPVLVTTSDIEDACKKSGLATSARIVSSRLKELGWLIETPQRGVWEFAPAESAGAYSSSDPMIPIKAFRLAHPHIMCALTFQTAAWALGFANRVPARLEIAFSERPKVKVPSEVTSLTFRWNLGPIPVRSVSCLCAESVLVHMAHRPNAVRSWQSAFEWLPDLAGELEADLLIEELQNRPTSTWAKVAYLLAGMRPDITKALSMQFSPKGKTRFGTGGKALRNDERYMISDYVLPEDPRKMRSLI